MEVIVIALEKEVPQMRMTLMKMNMAIKKTLRTTKMMRMRSAMVASALRKS